MVSCRFSQVTTSVVVMAVLVGGIHSLQCFVVLLKPVFFSVILPTADSLLLILNFDFYLKLLVFHHGSCIIM